MTETMIDYEALIERLHGDEPITGVGETLRGHAAAAAGHAMLLGEYGSDKAKRGPSPTVRGRIAEHEYAALEQLEVRTGESESALVRVAVHMLLQMHQVAS
ncbi:hypothetical protein SAMN04489740_4283 [Arthrobacter alpinus]|uniref:Uncharacterized protein n=1 Tax=Arthrobacter alpinus TaxID=656366 RepID=A0A1H5PGB4_9MICC|nr:hypothetical protein [Arthrobacter alpinus]SEF12756.1 hypothetical protein SAMN04489740_4283 [Arthrobacter alpinus]